MMRRRVLGFLVFASMCLLALPAWASTSTTFGNATAEFDGLFRTGLYILGTAGLMTIAYSVARNRYNLPWDESIATVGAVAVGASAPAILGWVGSAAGATFN